MKKILGFPVPAILLLSGAAVAACVTLAFPFPPLPIKISFTSVARAKLKGYPNPLNAAAMMAVDDIGIKAAGLDRWQDTNYQGYFTYQGPVGGASTMYLDKPCKSMAIDLTPGGRIADVGNGNSGGFEGGSGGGMCGGSNVGIVGYQEQYEQVQVCTDGACQTQTVLVGLTPIYGSIDGGTC